MAPDIQDFPGLNILLMGPAGTGKTHSLGTFVDNFSGDCFYLGLEPGLESLLGYWSDNNKPVPANLHWHMVKAPQAAIGELMTASKDVLTMSYEMLSKVQDKNKTKHDRFYKTLCAMSDFVSDRTKKSFGAVSDWGNDKVLFIDGLTGISRGAMENVIGNKPVRSMPDWMLAQGLVEKFLYQVTENCRAHVVLISHVERETDQILGGVKIMASTLGAKLAPKIPTMFSDVILCDRSGNKFTWDTANPQADLKTRSLPIAAGQPPDFGPIIKKWESRKKASEAV